MPLKRTQYGSSVRFVHLLSIVVGCGGTRAQSQFSTNPSLASFPPTRPREVVSLEFHLQDGSTYMAGVCIRGSIRCMSSSGVNVIVPLTNSNIPIHGGSYSCDRPEECRGRAVTISVEFRASRPHGCEGREGNNYCDNFQRPASGRLQCLIECADAQHRDDLTHPTYVDPQSLTDLCRWGPTQYQTILVPSATSET
jgi:hypothetical protein